MRFTKISPLARRTTIVAAAAVVGLAALLTAVTVQGAARSGFRVPSSVDWSLKGVLAPVADQKVCGGDYAFAAAAAVHSLLAISKKPPADVSVQQILDCSSAYGGKGCNGAYRDTALEYIKAHGVTTEDAYPYTANSGACRIEGGAIRIRDYKVVPKGDCKALAAAVTRQPVVAAMQVTNAFMNYKGGVVSKSDCEVTDSNRLMGGHAILIVGYTPDYWIVQNSWGADWGEHGFFRMARGNTCGICDLAVYPTGARWAAAPKSAAAAKPLQFTYMYRSGPYVRVVSGTVKDPAGLWNALQPLQPPPGARGGYGLIGDDYLLHKEDGYGLRQLGAVARRYVAFDSIHVEQPSGMESIGVQAGTFTRIEDLNDTTLGWVFFDLRGDFEDDLKKNLGK